MYDVCLGVGGFSQAEVYISQCESLIISSLLLGWPLDNLETYIILLSICLLSWTVSK